MEGPLRAEDRESRDATADSSRFRQLADVLERHPLIVVSLVAALVAAGHVVWIWNHRHHGGLDPDEAGYLATALRIEGRLVDLDAGGLVRSIGGTGNGVVVPVLSVPFTVLFGRDARAAMMAQPVLMVLAAVGAAGITRRLAGPIASIAAGVLVAGMPAATTAAQSYGYGLGATAALVVAVWALLESDRGANRWLWVLGAAVAAMLLSRTMTVGFVPGLFLAALILAGRDPAKLRRFTAALCLGLLAALPWYVASWSTTVGYLLGYGYGDRARYYGSGGWIERIGLRWSQVAGAFGTPTYLLLVAAAICTAAVTARTIEWRQPSDRLRSWLAVASTAALGFVALVSTANTGTWFELPIAVLAVPLLVAVIARGPKWMCAGLVSIVSALCIVGLAGGWWLLPYRTSQVRSHYEPGFAQVDARFASERRSEHIGAGQEWDRLNRSVLASMRDLVADDEDLLVTMSGNMQLMNQNTLTFTGELEGWTPPFTAPDTTGTAEMLGAELTPTTTRRGREVTRLVVLVRHDFIHFPADLEVDRFAELAADAGWSVVEAFPMPSGGDVQVLRHRPLD